jgi:hypothetical protein
MRASRRQVRWLSVALAFMLLFTQLARAAHACTTAVEPPPAAAVHACEGHEDAAPAADATLLCKAHCQQGSEALQQDGAADPQTAPLLLAVLDWSAVGMPATVHAARAPLVPSGAPPPGSPPLYLSLLVLRR